MSDPHYTTVAYVSGDRFAVSNPARDSFVPEFPTGLRVWADCQADGVRLGTVTAVTHDADAGRTLVDLAVDAGAQLTSNLATVLHGNDVPDSLCCHADQHAVGGRDALLRASTAVSGLVKLASVAEAQAGSNADKAVTPAGLAAAAKGLVSANLTIFVATTGSDGTGDGSAGAPYASIAKALSSIAGKLIAGGVVVTIQVADGVYAPAATIVVDHPDADKIQILGNTSAETTVAVASLDTTARTITVAGNFAASIQAGDILGLTGSSTGGLNGAYLVSGVVFSGGNTVITCSAETIASAAAGGGSIVIKPCNRCVLSFPAGVTGINATRKLNLLNGFRLNSAGGTASGILMQEYLGALGAKMIVNGFAYGIQAANNALLSVLGGVVKNCTQALVSAAAKLMVYSPGVILDGCSLGAKAQTGGLVYLQARIERNLATQASPAIGTVGGSLNLVTTSTV